MTNKLCSFILAVFFAGMALLAPASAKPLKEKNKPGATNCMTREQGDAILEELKQIRTLLEKQQAAVPAPARPPVPAALNVKISPDATVLGSRNAPLTLVEFSDYQCVFCRRFHVETLPELKKNFIDTGKLRVYSRDMPLSFHSSAFKAAVAARCAGEQGKFWDLRDMMVANANTLSPDAILKFAEHGAKLNMTTFRQCFDSNKYDEAIRKDVAEAASLGIEGTPSFVLGKSTPDGVEGVVVVGAQPYAAFESEIQKLLQR